VIPPAVTRSIHLPVSYDKPGTTRDRDPAQRLGRRLSGTFTLGPCPGRALTPPGAAQVGSPMS